MINPTARLEVMRRSGNLCECCRRHRAVHMHHLTYERASWNGVGEETPEDIRHLCLFCHEKQHPEKAREIRKFEMSRADGYSLEEYEEEWEQEMDRKEGEEKEREEEEREDILREPAWNLSQYNASGYDLQAVRDEECRGRHATQREIEDILKAFAIEGEKHTLERGGTPTPYNERCEWGHRRDE